MGDGDLTLGPTVTLVMVGERAIVVRSGTIGGWPEVLGDGDVLVTGSATKAGGGGGHRQDPTWSDQICLRR